MGELEGCRGMDAVFDGPITTLAQVLSVREEMVAASIPRLRQLLIPDLETSTTTIASICTSLAVAIKVVECIEALSYRGGHLRLGQLTWLD